MAVRAAEEALDPIITAAPTVIEAPTETAGATTTTAATGVTTAAATEATGDATTAVIGAADPGQMSAGGGVRAATATTVDRAADPTSEVATTIAAPALSAPGKDPSSTSGSYRKR